MKHQSKYQQNIQMTPEQNKRFEKFIMGDDLDFYEEYIINLSDEDQVKFFEENPDFMSEFPVNRDKIYLLKDALYRNILRKIKRDKRRKRDGNKVKVC